MTRIIPSSRPPNPVLDGEGGRVGGASSHVRNTEARLSARTVRVWRRIHTWSSLFCTVFLLMLCLTGLPLIFHEEIDEWLGDEPTTTAVQPTGPQAGLDKVVQVGLALHPGQMLRYVIFSDDNTDVIKLNIAPALDTPRIPGAYHIVSLDARDATVLGERPGQSGVMNTVLRLHRDLLAGLWGGLFLGAMALLFVLALVSGVVLYAPFTRRLPFGTVRLGRSRRFAWLDLHNLFGIATVTWMLVVGVTGAVNTLAVPLFQLWQTRELADMVAPYRGRPLPSHLAPVEQVLAAATASLPGMTPSFLAVPGTLFSSPRHYAVFMRGSTPLTSRMLKPVFIDGETGLVTDVRDEPWYLTLLKLCQPLHFGDYGGLPLKVLWALLDVVSMAVIGTGLYLWATRHPVIRSALLRP